MKHQPNPAIEGLTIQGINIVRTQEEVVKVLDILQSNKDRIHSWDTETVDIDVKEEAVVGNGNILCLSVFIGPDIDFGNGPCVFIDNSGQSHELIQELKPYFENGNYKKVFHNYGFDRHMINNHGIEVEGFGGDTMHMARLVDPSRGPQEYSLENSTKYYSKLIMQTKTDMIQLLKSKYSEDPSRLEALHNYQTLYMDNIVKTKMKKIFGHYKILKNGQQGKQIVYPDTHELHTSEQFIKQWVEYTCLDTESTFFLYYALQRKLQELIIDEFKGFDSVFYVDGQRQKKYSLYQLYNQQWLPLGQILTDMEKEGFKINRQHFIDINRQAKQDVVGYQKVFKEWVVKVQNFIRRKNNVHVYNQEVEDRIFREFNESSSQQLCQLFFAPYKRNKRADKNKKVSEKQTNVNGIERNVVVKNEFELKKGFKIDNPFYGLSIEQVDLLYIDQINPKKKYIDLEVMGLGMDVVSYTDGGLPQIDMTVLQKLAGNVNRQDYGLLYEFMKKEGEEQLGIEGCIAIDSLIQQKSIETLQQTFIEPMLRHLDSNDRIHCSLNINTETGRLSSRKPNLQNQPALEKDKYRIREGFVAEKGNKLIVADYGQLELRILAHMSGCKTMLDGFRQGGDFHSRTAMTMFDYIKQDIEDGGCSLEGSEGILVKDKYGSERRKAKAMNFSIAYGKSSYGFAKDWGVSVEEAQETVDSWYKQRQAIKKWQDKQKEIALEKGYCQTMMGRYRNLTRYFSNLSNRGNVMAGLRCSINTPIQGSAADIVICSMIRIHQDQWLIENGWKLILQIHDELVIEGPEQTAQQALERVKMLMSKPIHEKLKLKIDLDVDAKIVDNWYQAK